LERVAAIEAALPDGLYVTGSPYRGVGVPDCIHQAQLTAVTVIKEQLNQLTPQPETATVFTNV
jgi:protoporphyrinogen oxidase